MAMEDYSAEFVRDGIVLANDVAITDPYRAATHNKGIMNGVDAVALATGNDWRAIEAGAHAFACRAGEYRSLTSWAQDVSERYSPALHANACAPASIARQSLPVASATASTPFMMPLLCVAAR